MADPVLGFAGAKKSIPGSRRAAAVLLGLGPEVAQEVFRLLSEEEIRSIAQGARELKKSAPAVVGEALSSFVDAMEQVGGEVVAGDELLREMASASVHADVVRRAFDNEDAPPTLDEALGPVATADPQALAMVLTREQPQTVALVLGAMPPERAAAVMEHIPAAQQSEIVRRMALVDSVAPEVLREVRAALTTELQALVAEGMRKVDGRSAALEVLRRSTAEQQAEVLANIEKEDATLAEELRAKLFTFDDLSRLTDRDIQALAKEIDSNQLTVALKGASPSVLDKFLRNMSSRASQLLRDDIDAMGPTKLSAVEAAQSEIAKTAGEMAQSGRITIVRATDKML